MKLYYYMCPDYLLENLQKRRVKVSRYGKYGALNDPFELSPYDISDREFRAVHKGNIDELAQKMGLICLSKTRISPAMWAHYTDNHKGACLEFEVTSSDLFEVKYHREKLFKGITLDTYKKHLNLSNLMYILGTNSKDWKYEKEYRMNVVLDNKIVVREGCLHFMPFHKRKDTTFKLKHIWVGYKCGLGISNLMSDVENYRHKVNVTQTRPAFESFSVVEQRDQKFWNMEPGVEPLLPAEKAVFD